MTTEALVGLVPWRRRTALSRPKHSASVLLSGKERRACCDLEIGDSGTYVQASIPAVSQFFADVELLLEVVHGGLKVTSWLTDRTGQRVTHLDRNEWNAVSPPGWHCDYTSDAVEVCDGSRIVFQAKLVSGRVQIQGEWWRNDINGMRLVKGDDPVHPGAFMMFFGPTSRPQSPEIQSIFDGAN